MKQEADHAQRGSPERAEPQRTNGVAEPRPIDILELLSKAKEEYQRVRRQTHTCRCKHNMLLRFLDKQIFFVYYVHLTLVLGTSLLQDYLFSLQIIHTKTWIKITDCTWPEWKGNKFWILLHPYLINTDRNTFTDLFSAGRCSWATHMHIWDYSDTKSGIISGVGASV